MLAKKRKLEQQENEGQTPGCKLHVVNLMYPRTSGRNPESRLLQKLRSCFDFFRKKPRIGSIAYLSLSWAKSANYASKHSSCRVDIVSFAAVIRVVTRHATLLSGEERCVTRDDPNNGCEGD